MIIFWNKVFCVAKGSLELVTLLPQPKQYELRDPWDGLAGKVY